MKKRFSTFIISLIAAILGVIILLSAGLTTLVLPSAFFVLGAIGLVGALLATSCVCSPCDCPSSPCFVVRKPLTLWGLGLLIFAIIQALRVVAAGTLTFGLGTVFFGLFLIVGTLLTLILSAVCFPKICCSRAE